MSHLGERLTALIDGELGHDERDRAFAHLAVCATCRAEAEALRQVKRRLYTLPDPMPSAQLMSRLLDVAEPGEPLPPRPPCPLTRAGRGLPADLFPDGPLAGPPPPAAAVFLGFTGNPPLGSRALGQAGPSLANAGRSLDDPRCSAGHRTGRAWHLPGGRRVRARYVVAGAVSLATLAVGTAFFLGGEPPTSAPPVTPQVDVFAVEHALTSGDIVFDDPAGARVLPRIGYQITGP